MARQATYSSLYARDLVFPLRSIYLSLDPVSLKNSRLVCKEWNGFIKRRVWGTAKDSEPNTRLRQRLAYHWIHATPTVKSVVVQPDSSVRSVCSLSCDDSIVVVCWPRDHNAKVYDLVNLNLLAVLDFQPPPTHRPYNEFGVADVGRDVVATVMLNGDVFVWRRSDWSPVFKGRPHGDNGVIKVKVLDNLIITGGQDSKLALLSWDGDQVSLMRMIVDEALLDTRPITGLDSDGEWLVYGTSRKLSVWNLADNKLAHTYNIQSNGWVGQGSSMVLNYPYAVVVKNVDEVMVIELPTGQIVKSLYGYAANTLNHNKSILVGSGYRLLKPPGVYICDLRQMTNPQQNGPHWKRRKDLEHGAGWAKSCVNTSCVVAVQINKLYVWDFWNCDNFDDTPDGFINDVD